MRLSTYFVIYYFIITVVTLIINAIFHWHTYNDSFIGILALVFALEHKEDA